MIVDKIYEYLSDKNKTIDEALRYEVEKIAGVIFKRQFMSETNEVEKGTIRLSSVGRCPRQTAYMFHGFERNGKEIDSRARIVFWTGDLAEMTIIALGKAAGCQIYASGLQQQRIHLIANGFSIPGHPDGIHIDDDNKVRLIEVKSMSSYGFELFQNNKIDFSYIAQINAYMEAKKLDETIMIAYNKDSGILSERIIKKDDNVVKEINNNILLIINSSPESLPEPPGEYEPNSKGFYAWQCLYCPYWGHCRTDAEKVLVGKSYKLKRRDNGLHKDKHE
ncbi:MAG: hypothetical protein GF317_03380 [Candidatus Lokiarchaeota archaeon]|nr:hypothetical protein [Candidatus Lokiarchaeota archaeon]MBD3350047.1 hypothetical protein [Candidatus Lokiarchaeota archaeon]